MNLTPLVKLLVRRPRTIFLAFTIITILVGFQASNLYMESDFSTFLPKDNPIIDLWTEINEEFQIGTTIIIYVEANDIRDPEVLKEIDRVSSSRNINLYENDDGEQDGVFSVRCLAKLIREENANLPLPGDLGGTGENEIPDDINLIYKYMSRDSIQQMEGILFTNNYNVAVIVIQLAENADYDDILARVEYAIGHKGTTFTDMTVTGTIAMQQAIQEKSMEQIIYIFPWVIVFISAVLLFFHRNFKSIIIAFLPTTYALVLTFGFLGIVKPQLTLISISIVALIMGLGVDYSIHLMNRFAEENTLEDKLARTEKTLKSTGKAVLLSTITTMIGFGALMISSMSPMVVFGFSCAMGILFCFVSAIILVPCLTLILKFEKVGRVSSLKKFANFVMENRKRVIIIAIFFAIMSLIVLPQVETDVNYIDMAPEGIPEIEALQKYADNFGAGTNFNALLVETDYQGLTYPEVIEVIYNMEQEMKQEGINAYSIIDEIKGINDIIERNELLERLYEYTDADKILFDRIVEEGMINEDYSKTLIFISIPVGKSIEDIENLVNKINYIALKTVMPQNGRVSILTGQDAVNVAINKKLADEQIRSMIIALLLVLAALIVIFNSSIYGLLTMVPVGLVLIWEPGFLVTLNIPLSVVTISIASIMIGIGIDYAVHITQRVREELAEGLSKIDATKISIEKTGLSLIEAASTTVAGLIAIYFVSISALQQFAIIVILMSTLSCIAAALILPIFYNLKYVK
ncbi:MAG: MMPL family transporter [Thermoplasmatales archaeon]|nr:MAG: MMPL family transporter [Thermoplasmatales archaeon]